MSQDTHSVTDGVIITRPPPLAVGPPPIHLLKLAASVTIPLGYPSTHFGKACHCNASSSSSSSSSSSFFFFFFFFFNFISILFCWLFFRLTWSAKVGEIRDAHSGHSKMPHTRSTNDNAFPTHSTTHSTVPSPIDSVNSPSCADSITPVTSPHITSPHLTSAQLSSAQLGSAHFAVDS
ncbi:hypothetical protein TcWFU_005698 [Taenia crassiceps]|uniref:Uncharacterized protein n=1 Tax=Taenia crassiceps TaxID=6207 RepID=A0ABR4PZC7_9CEST